MPEELFSGLPAVVELCEGAPIIYTHNLWVSAGLMNGTRGIVRAIVYRKGGRPDHVLPHRRLPAVLLVECDEFAGAPFFDTISGLGNRPAQRGSQSPFLVGVGFGRRVFKRQRCYRGGFRSLPLNISKATMGRFQTTDSDGFPLSTR